MTPADLVVDLMLRQAGDRYRFGAEVSADDPDPDMFDCSELIEWACARVGVQPRFPDGSWLQYRHVHRHGTIIPESKALVTRGALLFRFRGGDPLAGPRPTSSHVAVSLGDNRTIEARSTQLGVGVFGNTRARDWTHAGTIPGVDYTGHVPDESIWSTLPLLRKGATGGMVARAQGLLLATRFGPAGLVNRSGYPDGQFGPGTDREVRAFQKTLGLVVDGIVGPITWRHLILGAE